MNCFFFISRFIEAKMTDFDHISAHSFRHLPSLWALGGWQLPLWCENMPFGKYTALWRALLNYPKTFSSCTFIMPRKDNQGERHALKDRSTRADALWRSIDWDVASKERLPRAERVFFYCFMHHPTEWFIAFQQAAEQTLALNSWLKPLNSPDQRGLTPFALGSSSF